MKKNILCFGDSNTWGSSPVGGRYDETIRWPMRMATILGDDYRVIEEGFGGRTTIFDDPTEGGYKSGSAYLPPCLMSHNPLDLVIIMLGTNDTKQRFSMNAFTIAQGMGTLVKQVREYGQSQNATPPKILVVSPILIGENLMDTGMGMIFGSQSIETAKSFSEEYRKLSLLWKTEFFDAATVATPSRIDAIHLDRSQQLALAEALSAKVQSIL